MPETDTSQEQLTSKDQKPAKPLNPNKSRPIEWLIGIGIGLFLVVVLVIAIVGFLIFTYHPVPRVQKQTAKSINDNDMSNWKEVKKESEDIGIVLKIPKDWGAVNHYIPAPYGLNYFYLIPKNNTLIWNNGDNFIKNRLDDTKSCCEISFYLSDKSYDTSFSYPEKQTRDTSYKGANNEIKLIDTTHKYTSTDTYTYIFNKSGKTLWLTYYPLPGQSDEYLKTIELIISTIKLI